MSQPPSALAHFRAECYQAFGLRRDALSDLLDAVLTGERVTSLVQLSQSPLFRRKWSSLFDALADGRIDRAGLQQVLGRWVPPPAADQRAVWAIDGSSWPRPEAETSLQRTCVRVVQPGTPQSRITGGWEYQWLMVIPETQGSWVLPLAVGRRHPTAGTPTDLAIRQVRQAVAARPAGAPRPVVVLDSHYDVVQLAPTQLPVDWLARLAKNRRFYREPPPYPGRGCPAKHGPVFRLADPTTHGVPDVVQRWDDAEYGAVTLRRWDALHTQPAPQVRVTVVCISVAHLPRRATAPAPLWLVWHGQRCPADLRQLWGWYQRRFAIEHGFRFLKQSLGWTVPRLRRPARADRWSWLLALVLWQLWLGRALVTDARLPWERPRPPAHLSPGRVRRAMGAVLATLGTRAPPPQPRGIAPGRHVGDTVGPSKRYPIHRRTPKPTP
jgi:hypothetical protein